MLIVLKSGTFSACPCLYRDYYSLIMRDAVYSGSTRYSVKLADYIISIKEFVLINCTRFSEASVNIFF